MKQWEVLTQDAFCYPGCLPEGYGPESNGDRFNTREEALSDACDILRAILSDVEACVESPAPNVVDANEQELRKTGEWSATLPYIDDETGEESTDGTRFVSIAVVEVA